MPQQVDSMPFTATPTPAEAAATLTATGTAMPTSLSSIVALSATITPIETITPEAVAENISPTPYPLPRSPESGETFRFEEVAQAAYSGVTYRLSHLLIAKRELVLPELYAYSPLLVGKQTLLYTRVEVTNNGSAAVIAPPVGLLSLLDEKERALDAIRLADYFQAGTVLPHTSDQSLEPGESYTLGFWLGTDAAPDEILGLDLVLNCPVPQGSPNCLGNVILSASLPHDKPLAQFYDLEQVRASSGFEPVEIGGVTFELARLFVAPRHAVPEIADLLPASSQTVVQFIYRITNQGEEAHTVRYLENAMFAWDVRPPEQPEKIYLTDFYAAGLSFTCDPDDGKEWMSHPLQPGETILAGVWFGLPVSVADLGKELFTTGGLVCQAGVEPGPQTCGGKSPSFNLAVPASYAPFPSLATPVQPQESALPESQVCQGLQPTIQAAIPKEGWGLKYQTNAANPPEMKLLGVTSGQVSTLEVSGRWPEERYRLDLARLYYLNSDGSLEDVWVVLGMTALSFPDQPYYSFGLGAQGWRSSEEAWALFSQPGQVYQVVISDWYVHPDGLHWGQCYASRTALPFECDLGLLLDRGRSTQFFESGVAPDEPALPAPVPQAQASGATARSVVEGWIAIGWGLYPREGIPPISFPTECP